MRDAFSFSKSELARRFLEFADAPDELAPGINYDEILCPKGKKASKKCKDKNGDKDEDNSNTPSKTADSTQPSKSADENQPIQTSTQPSASTIDAGPTATADCAAIGRKDLQVLLEDAPSVEGEESAKRARRTTFQSRRLESRRFSFKEAETCVGSSKVFLNSKKYPTASEKVMVSQQHVTN